MKKENSHKYIIIGFIIAAIFIANGIISARTAQTQAPPGGTSNLNGLIVGGQKVSLADDTNRPTTYVSGGLYGWCTVQQNRFGSCSRTALPPASCTGAAQNTCSCPSGFTRITLSEDVDSSLMVTSTYTCYKN